MSSAACGAIGAPGGEHLDGDRGLGGATTTVVDRVREGDLLGRAVGRGAVGRGEDHAVALLGDLCRAARRRADGRDPEAVAVGVGVVVEHVEHERRAAGDRLHPVVEGLRGPVLG